MKDEGSEGMKLKKPEVLNFFPQDDARLGIGMLGRGRLTFFPPDDGRLGVSVDIAREGRVVPEIDCCMTRLPRELRSV